MYAIKMPSIVLGWAGPFLQIMNSILKQKISWVRVDLAKRPMNQKFRKLLKFVKPDGGVKNYIKLVKLDEIAKHVGIGKMSIF